VRDLIKAGFVTLVLSLCLATSVAAGPFEDGLASYQSGDYAMALLHWRPLAEQGSPEAQSWIGYMYANGMGVPPDFAAAMTWYHKAAGQGYAKAQYNIGTMYDRGEGVPQDKSAAATWYREAAEQGFINAQTTLGVMYQDGRGVPKDYAAAATWFRKAANQGDYEAQTKLGYMYASGQGVPQDAAAATAWYRKAADQSECHTDTDIVVFQGTASAQRIAMADGSMTTAWFLTTATPACVWEGPPFQRKVIVSRFQIIGSPPPAGVAIELAGTLSNFGSFKVARYYVETGSIAAIKVISGHRIAAATFTSPASSVDSQDATTAAGDPNVAYAVQLALFGLGFDVWQHDGRLGEETRSAIRKYEQSVGIPEDGLITPRLVASVQTASDIAVKQDSQAPTTSQQSLKVSTTGSGFYVSNAALLLTNYHVVEGCRAISIPGGSASVVGVDPQNDLALLSAPPRSGGVAALRVSPAVRAGERVVAVGFPLVGFLAEQANVTTGDVSSLAGIGNDSRYLQITAPVQPGNSGGPLFDVAGNIIGVVSAKLDAIKVAGITGDIPENVNFALNVSVVRAFLDSRGIAYQTAASATERSAPDIGDWGKSITQLVECWQ
jgi:uncharacterized protein